MNVPTQNEVFVHIKLPNLLQRLIPWLETTCAALFSDTRFHPTFYLSDPFYKSILLLSNTYV